MRCSDSATARFDFLHGAPPAPRKLRAAAATERADNSSAAGPTRHAARCSRSRWWRRMRCSFWAAPVAGCSSTASAWMARGCVGRPGVCAAAAMLVKSVAKPALQPARRIDSVGGRSEVVGRRRPRAAASRRRSGSGWHGNASSLPWRRAWRRDEAHAPGRWMISNACRRRRGALTEDVAAAHRGWHRCCPRWAPRATPRLARRCAALSAGCRDTAARCDLRPGGATQRRVRTNGFHRLVPRTRRSGGAGRHRCAGARRPVAVRPRMTCPGCRRRAHRSRWRMRWPTSAHRRRPGWRATRADRRCRRAVQRLVTGRAALDIGQCRPRRPSSRLGSNVIGQRMHSTTRPCAVPALLRRTIVRCAAKALDMIWPGRAPARTRAEAASALAALPFGTGLWRPLPRAGCRCRPRPSVAALSGSATVPTARAGGLAEVVTLEEAVSRLERADGALSMPSWRRGPYATGSGG